MTTYNGWRDEQGTCHVVIDNDAQRPLPLRLDLDNHSPTGFEWGYGGSGPAQLALALLAHALRNSAIALKLHQPFKWAIVAQLKRDASWQMTDTEVRRIARDLAKEKENV